ncbi:hypothetical protein ACTHPH_01985 [Paenibacillus pasadenensis]|nr:MULTISPECIES: hypothetical protein [Paenibacillus]
MGIACRPLLEGSEEFLELERQGKKRIVNRTRSHRMKLMAGLLAKNKEASNLLLRRHGLAVPNYVVVSGHGEEAARFLAENRPIVVKPLDASNSVGVTLRVADGAQLEEAVASALRHSGKAMLQKYVEGTDVRIVVIGGRVVGVLEYVPAFLIGDGEATIEQLVSRLNEAQLARTGDRQEGSYQPVDLGSAPVMERLRACGLGPASVLGQEERLELYPDSTLAADSIREIVLDRSADCHPHLAEAAARAASALELDVAGIDIRCKDIASPLEAENGGILEVNALPDLIDPHLFLTGDSIDVFRIYLDYLFEE